MRHIPARAGIVMISLACCVAGCGSATISSVRHRSSVPPEFRAACGHPGAHVEVRKVPVTVRHADCDLTGVSISYKNFGGATVRKGPGGTGIGSSSGFRLSVAPGSLDVTVSVSGSTPAEQ